TLAEEQEINWKLRDAQARVQTAESEHGYKKLIDPAKAHLLEIEAGKDVAPANFFNSDGGSPLEQMLNRPYSCRRGTLLRGEGEGGSEDEEEDGDFDGSEPLASPDGDDDLPTLEDSDWDDEEEDE